MKCLIYITKSKPYLYGNPYILKTEPDHWETRNNRFDYGCDNEPVNGKIVAEFDDEVEEVMIILNKDIVARLQTPYHTNKLSTYEFLKRSCLTADMVKEYNPNYAIHIKDLEAFDKPKELSDFYRYDNSYNNMWGWMFEDREKFIPLKKAPQNMMYVYDKDGNKYVLISIRPEWGCKILNGEKDVELRRKVLKEML